MLKPERKLIDWLVRQKDILFFGIVTFLAFLARLNGLDFVSGDMYEFLIPWANQFRAIPGFAALKTQIGNYNILYQVLIILIVRLPGSVTHLYKYISIFFDYLLALICANLIRKEREERLFSSSFTVAYTVVLFLPTVILNSAVWGQCDAMYAFTCILAFDALYRRHYIASFIALGLAFALKMQTIFILPLYLYVYICRKDFSLLHFLISLLTLWATGIPAYLQGRPLTTVFDIYLTQMGEYPQMILNNPSIWNFFFPDYTQMHICALVSTVVVLGLFLYHLLNHSLVIQENLGSFLIVAAWSAWTCFLFLPSMHERYSYLVDLFLVLLALVSHKYLPYAISAVCISGITYTNYLQYGDIPFSVPYLTFIAVITWCIFTFRVLPTALISERSRSIVPD